MLWQSDPTQLQPKPDPKSTRLAKLGILKKHKEVQDTGLGVYHPCLNVSHYVNPRGVGKTNAISCAELAAVAATNIHSYSHGGYTVLGMLRLHRYVCLWGASEALKSCNQTKKGAWKKQGKRASRHSATKEATLDTRLKRSSNELYSNTEVGRQAGSICKGWQDVHANSPAECVLILNSVPVPFVTDPELIRPSISVMTHPLDQKAMARKVKAIKWTAEIVGNIQVKVERQHKLVISFFVIPPTRSNPQRYTKMCVISPPNSAGVVSLMWCQICQVLSSPRR